MFCLKQTRNVFKNAYSFSTFVPKSLSYYEILGIPKTATPEEIKLAYREKAKLYHPDVNTTGEVHQPSLDKFREIAEAYSILSVPETRATYDIT